MDLEVIVKEVTVWVPEERIPDFYRKFGEFMADTETSFLEGSASTNRVPAWASGPDAVELVGNVWRNLSSAGQTALGFLIDGALRERPEKFTPQDLVDELGHPNGSSGIAGVFGSAGRAVKKAGVPRYRLGDSDSETWHFVWDWDGSQYWMAPEVAALFRQAQSR